jgi:hypothetical protein
MESGLLRIREFTDIGPFQLTSLKVKDAEAAVYVAGFDNNKDIDLPHNVIGVAYFAATRIH